MQDINSISWPPTKIESSHVVEGFDCGTASLNEWLQRRAQRNEGLTSRTYVICAQKHVMGYYSLAAGSVARRDVPGKIQRNIVDPIPSIVLGRLAVHQTIRRQRAGEGLLQHALLRIHEASEIVGARLILVHAIDREAASFYLKYGFEEFPPNSNTLFLKVETLKNAR